MHNNQPIFKGKRAMFQMLFDTTDQTCSLAANRWYFSLLESEGPLEPSSSIIMPFQVSTVMVDYQLESVPSDEQLVNGVVKPFSKLTKTEFVQVRAENSLREIQVIGQ